MTLPTQYNWICDKCEKIVQSKHQTYCRCTGVMLPMQTTDKIYISNKIPPCVHRGKLISLAGCGCNDTKSVYECGVFGKCALVKQTCKGCRDAQVCSSCDRRETYTKARVGFAMVCANEIGGVETWLKNLIPHLSVSGVATYDKPKAQGLPVPVLHGAFDDLAATSDIVFVWGITQRLPVGPKYVAVHHGDLRSEWANQVFRKQLSWCHTGVAINERVALEYGVHHLPNPVSPPQPNVQPAHSPFAKTVFWNHRSSSEKHPEKALAIAEALPKDWGLVMTSEGQSTNKVHFVGKLLDPNPWYQASDVFLSTTDQEGFGYSCAEAITSLLPVVSTPYGIANNLYPRLCCELDAPVSEWVSMILVAYNLYPLPQRIRKANFLQLQHGKEAIAMWKDFVK